MSKYATINTDKETRELLARIAAKNKRSIGKQLTWIIHDWMRKNQVFVEELPKLSEATYPEMGE